VYRQLHVGEGTFLEQTIDEGSALARICIEIGGSMLEDFLWRFVAKYFQADFVAIQDPAVESGPECADLIPLEEQAVSVANYRFDFLTGAGGGSGRLPF
jgi:hypothetical protein